MKILIDFYNRSPMLIHNVRVINKHEHFTKIKCDDNYAIGHQRYFDNAEIRKLIVENN